MSIAIPAACSHLLASKSLGYAFPIRKKARTINTRYTPVPYPMTESTPPSELTMKTPITSNAKVLEKICPNVDSPENPFENALFIGDSRTVGLYEYAGISDADFYANTGMSVFTMFKDESEGNVRDVLLEQLLVPHHPFDTF